MNRQYRGIQQKIWGMATSDGGGVKLTRVIGSAAMPMLEPFLMFDEFGSENPGDYIGGFPSSMSPATPLLYEHAMRHRVVPVLFVT